MSLKITKACGTTSTTVNVNTASSSIIVIPATLGLTKLDMQIYTFELTVVQQNATKVVDTRCLFLSCDAACAVKDILKTAKDNKEDLDKALAYYALLQSNNCSDCSCADLCNLFNIVFINTEEDARCAGCNQH